MMTMMMKKTKMMNGIKRCGYTPYGYIIYINNRRLEFATETEADEYILEVENGFDEDV